jgi:Protein of unknown function (DUF3149)
VYQVGAKFELIQLENPMKALIDLFSTDYGLMSVGVIVFILIMAVYFLRLFLNKINGM